MDNQIAEEKKGQAHRGLTQIQCSPYRILKTFLNTVGLLGVPIAWVPWDAKLYTPERSRELWWIGLITGFFSGFSFRSQENRFQNRSIAELDELHPRTPLTGLASRVWKWMWRIGLPTLIAGGLTTFVISQLINDSPDMKWEDKVAIGTMYTGVMLSFLQNLIVAKYWNLEERKKMNTVTTSQKIVDRLVVSQNLGRSLGFGLGIGIRPLYIYLPLVNLISVHSGQDLDLFARFMYWLAWYGYGTEMGNEFLQTWREERGTVFSAPSMLIVNAALTLNAVREGKA